MFNFSFISNQTIIQNVPHICHPSLHLMHIMQFPQLTIYFRVFTQPKSLSCSMFWIFGREWKGYLCLFLFLSSISGPLRRFGPSLYDRWLLPKQWTVANMINFIVKLNWIWLLGSNAEMARCSFFSNPIFRLPTQKVLQYLLPIAFVWEILDSILPAVWHTINKMLTSEGG